MGLEMKKRAAKAPAAPRKREETALLAKIRLAIGARPDILAVRINTGLYAAPHDPKQRIRSAPTGHPDLTITQARRVLEHYRRETNFSIFEEDRWLHYGQTIYIETKRPKGSDHAAGKLRKSQEDFQKAAEAVCAIYLSPTTVDEVIAALGPIPDWIEHD